MASALVPPGTAGGGLGDRRRSGGREGPGRVAGLRKLDERAGDRLGQRGRFRTRARRELQIAGGRPLAGVLGQAALDQPAHLGGYAVQVHLAVDRAVGQRGSRSAAERRFARGREGENGAQAEDVAGGTDLPAFDLLGGHVAGRAYEQSGTRQRAGLGRDGNAEIDDARPVLGQQHVRWLQVAVHDPRGMNGAQARRQPRREFQHRPHGQGPVLRHRVSQRWPGHIGRGQPRHRAIGIRVDQRHSEPAAHLARNGDFPPEARPELGVGGQVGADHFHRHQLAVRRCAQKHPAHATQAQYSAEPVRPDLSRVVRLQVLPHDHPVLSSGTSDIGDTGRGVLPRGCNLRWLRGRGGSSGGVGETQGDGPQMAQ